jgi:hypothetical protein
MVWDKPPAIIIPRPRELVKLDKRVLFTPAISFISSGRFGVATPVSNTFLTFDGQDTAAATVHTYSGTTFGAADGTRRIVLLVHWSAAVNISSVTIGGVTATAHTTRASGTANDSVQIFSALVPTGTSGNIVITFASGVSRSGFGSWRQINESSATPFATGTDNTVTAAVLSLTINIPTDGSLYAGATVDSSLTPPTQTWVGATERYDNLLSPLSGLGKSGASETGLGVQTGRTVSTTITGTSPGGALAAMSWG